MFEKVKNFCREHKHGIEMALNTVLSIGGGLFIGLAIGGLNSPPKMKFFENENYQKNDIPKIDLPAGAVSDYWEEQYGNVAIIDGLKLKDLGELGKPFCEMDGYNEDTSIDLVMDMYKNEDDVSD